MELNLSVQDMKDALKGIEQYIESCNIFVSCSDNEEDVEPELEGLELAFVMYKIGNQIHKHLLEVDENYRARYKEEDR